MLVEKTVASDTELVLLQSISGAFFSPFFTNEILTPLKSMNPCCALKKRTQTFFMQRVT